MHAACSVNKRTRPEWIEAAFTTPDIDYKSKEPQSSVCFAAFDFFAVNEQARF
jgi:hypothetical protein